MRLLVRLFFLLLLGAPFAVAGLALLAIEDQPLVNRAVDLSPERMARGQRILDANDPRKLQPGEVRTVQLSEDDLSAALNYLANRRAHGSASLRLKPDAANIRVTVGLPVTLLGHYLNGEMDLVPTAGLPKIRCLRIGRLSIPGVLADWVLRWAADSAWGQEAARITADAVREVKLDDGKLSLAYTWQPDLPARISAMTIPDADLERLRFYHHRQMEIARGTAKASSLADLLTPLLRSAGERSLQGDAVAENRAALVVLTFYVNRRNPAKILPGAQNWPAVHGVTLSGRDDFPKHFIISAAITATADSPLSDAIGLYKEIKDSRGGSGFSFNDLAADRAGTRFGEMAVASSAAALELQKRAAVGLREPDIMPATADLPEFMPEPEFMRRFGGVGAPAYTRMMVEIERRVASLPLYRR